MKARKMNRESLTVRKLLTAVGGLAATAFGLILLNRVRFGSQRDAGWYILPGLPLVGVGLAICLVAVSSGKALRILAGLLVIGVGLLLAAFGATDRRLDPDDPWRGFFDSRPWSVGLGLTVAGVGVFWSYIASVTRR